MSPIALALMIFGIMLVLMAVRVPIAISMFTAGAVGYVAQAGWLPLANFLNTQAFARFASYDLSVIPLFILMGNFATQGGISKALFEVASSIMSRFRGGLAMAAVMASAAFGAICGSSVATAATITSVALPEMKRHGYSGRLATGTLAAGGTLGILIPPSVPLVIYAILAEQNIAKLFAAALIPGIIAALGYIAVIALYCRLDPGAGPAAERKSVALRVRALIDVWPVLAIFVIVIGGIYGGIFTPTEAASVGTIGAGVLAVAKGMRFDGLMESLYSTAEATAMIFLILLGADVLNVFLALTQMPAELASWVSGSGLPPLLVLFAIIVIYVFLGCVMDSLSMILLTIPIFLPMVLGLEFWGLDQTEKAIWFGILALMVVEVGLITPPVGMNVYIINSMAKNVPMSATFRGIVPFLMSDALRVVLLVFFPVLTLFLVRLIG